MEVKKSPKADLEKRRGLYLEIGLVAALLLVVAAFAYRTIDRGIDKIESDIGPVEVELVEVTREDQTPPPPPEKVEIQVMSDQLQLIDNKATTDTKMNFDEFDDNTEIVIAPPKREEIIEEEIFVTAEELPSFNGGTLNDFRNWVQERLRYPAMAQEMGISGQVILSFVVETDGSLTHIEVLRSPDSSLSDEAIRVLKMSPKWKPARQRGKAVRLKHTLPIMFRIADS